MTTSKTLEALEKQLNFLKEIEKRINRDPKFLEALKAMLAERRAGRPLRAEHSQTADLIEQVRGESAHRTDSSSRTKVIDAFESVGDWTRIGLVMKMTGLTKSQVRSIITTTPDLFESKPDPTHRGYSLFKIKSEMLNKSEDKNA